MSCDECGAHVVRGCPWNFETGVGALESQSGAATGLDVLGPDRLPQQLATRLGLEFGHAARSTPGACFVARFPAAAPSHAASQRQADAARREHARERVKQDRVDAEGLGHRARVLAGRAAERQERESRRVVALPQRELADRVRHACHRDLQEGVRQRLDAGLRPCACRHPGRDRAQA